MWVLQLYGNSVLNHWSTSLNKVLCWNKIKSKVRKGYLFRPAHMWLKEKITNSKNLTKFSVPATDWRSPHILWFPGNRGLTQDLCWTGSKIIFSLISLGRVLLYDCGFMTVKCIAAPFDYSYSLLAARVGLPGSATVWINLFVLLSVWTGFVHVWVPSEWSLSLTFWTLEDIYNRHILNCSQKVLKLMNCNVFSSRITEFVHVCTSLVKVCSKQQCKCMRFIIT